MATNTTYPTMIAQDQIPAFMFEAVYGSFMLHEEDVQGLRQSVGENDVFSSELPLTMSETYYDTCDVFSPDPSAPPVPTSSHELLAWYLWDDAVSAEELAPALISQLESMWFKITGHPFAMYLADRDLLTIIQNLQYREHQMLRFYNDGRAASRAKMMELHARFFDEFGCRISDFHNNESFKRMIDALLAEQLV